jgi:hypothetical protein
MLKRITILAVGLLFALGAGAGLGGWGADCPKGATCTVSITVG